MKLLKQATLVLLFAISSAAAKSQVSSKAKMFDAFPESIYCPVDQFTKALNTKEGELIKLTFSDNFSFSGKVMSNIQKFKNLQTVFIKSNDFENTYFQLSKQILEDKSISFVGRIMNNTKADGYKLASDGNGNFKLIKFDSSNMLQDCSYIQ